MEKRKLGELQVSAIGLGCMSMTPVYAPPDPDEAVLTIHHALDHGLNLLDTSDAYNTGRNEALVGRAIRDRRDLAVLTTKFGNLRDGDGKQIVCGRPDYVAAACEASLARLGTDVIDLYLIHRIDPTVPIEDTVGAMADLVSAGKVRSLGMCEAGPETLRRAHATHPISALQSEYSLWSRDAEAEMLPLCAELGIGFMAYAPLGRGFLTGTIGSVTDLSETDRRRDHPRFQAENLSHNTNLVARLRPLAEEQGCSLAQLALAWLLAKEKHVVPIPGTSRRKWLKENIEAARLPLQPAVVSALEAIFPPDAAAGLRYPAGQMKRLGI